MQMNKLKYVSVWLILFLGVNLTDVKAQSDVFKLKQLGIEVQGYPTGIMPGICMDLTKWEHAAISTRVGFDIARRQDYSGLNDDERGWGPGFSLGYRYYAGGDCSGFYAGVRADMWWLTIAWKDSTNIPKQGSTDILVAIPTLELGYLFPFKHSPYKIGVGLSQGREFNLISNGKPVGQGYITLFTLKAVRAF